MRRRCRCAYCGCTRRWHYHGKDACALHPKCEVFL